MQPWWRTTAQSSGPPPGQAASKSASKSAGQGASSSSRATSHVARLTAGAAGEPPANAAQAGRRTWTLLGSLDGSNFGCVDRRGLVASGIGSAANWSLDWWFKTGADWVFPSHRSSVRQRLLKGSPVVETFVAVEGGEIRQRSFVARPLATSGRQRGSALENAEDELVVEIINDSNVAIAVALAVRPYDLQGLGRIDAISVDGGLVRISAGSLVDGSLVAGSSVDDSPVAGGSPAGGRVVLQADRTPGEVVFGSEGLDPAAVLVQREAQGAAAANAATSRNPASSKEVPGKDSKSVRCSLGLASVALVFPLVHGSVLRAAIPLSRSASTAAAAAAAASKPPGKSARKSARKSASKLANQTGRTDQTDQTGQAESAKIALSQLPRGESVSSGWRRQSDSCLTAQLGSEKLSEAFEAARTTLPLAIRGDSVSAAPFGPATSTNDETLVLAAAAEMGYSASVRDVLIARGSAVGRRGDIEWDGRDVTAASLIAAAHLLALQPDAKLTKAYGEIAADGARWLLASTKQLQKTRPPKSQSSKSQAPKNRNEPAAEQVGEQAVEIRRGLQAALELLELAGASKAARQLRLSIADLRAESKTASTRTSKRPRPDRAITGLLVADAQGSGNNLLATARRAFLEISASQVIGTRRLDALLVAASSTWSWPTISRTLSPNVQGSGAPSSGAQGGGLPNVQGSGTPNSGTQGAGLPNVPSAGPPSAGHDLRITALLVRCVRAMLLADSGPNFAADITQPRQLAIACVWPTTWQRAEVEVHNMATLCGVVSWAVRWHGNRPALLWEIKPHAQTGQTGETSKAAPITLTAPGLDRTFISNAWEGEALLAPPANPADQANPGNQADQAGL